MKKWALVLCFLTQWAPAQVKPTAEVVFSPTQINIGGQACFNYKKEGNRFTISDINGKPLFVGDIHKNVLGKFESSISFVLIGRQFHNPHIVGRNDLMIALVAAGVISRCNVDSDKLKAFYLKHNQS